MSFLDAFLFLAMVLGLVLFCGVLLLLLHLVWETVKDIWYLGWRGWFRMRRT